MEIGGDTTIRAQGALASASEGRAQAALRAAQGGKHEEAAEAFETLFSTLLVRELRRALPEGVFTGAGSDVYSSWFDEHLGKTLAEQDVLGLSGMVRTSLNRAEAAARQAETNLDVEVEG